jgi:hypothetical protein
MKKNWRMYLATLLLMTGVATVASEIREAWWWTVPGYAMLFFVPALIIDEARRRDEPRPSHRYRGRA